MGYNFSMDNKTLNQCWKSSVLVIYFGLHMKMLDKYNKNIITIFKIKIVEGMWYQYFELDAGKMNCVVSKNEPWK